MMGQFQRMKIEEVYQVFSHLNNFKMLNREKVLHLWFLFLIEYQKAQRQRLIKKNNSRSQSL
jgi:hypothetical protein